MTRLRQGSGGRARRYNYRSARTGKFVSKAYALKHPKTTVRERLQ